MYQDRRAQKTLWKKRELELAKEGESVSEGANPAGGVLKIKPAR